MQDAGVEADTVAWTIMITIWSRSKLSEKESKVQEIFERYALTLYRTLDPVCAHKSDSVITLHCSVLR